MQAGMRQHDQFHKQLDPDAEIDAADERILCEEWELAAGKVINRRPNASDEEVQGEAKDPDTGSAVDGPPAEQPGGNEDGNIPARLNADHEDVHSTANEGAHDNRQNSVVFHGWLSAAETLIDSDSEITDGLPSARKTDGRLLKTLAASPDHPQL